MKYYEKIKSIAKKKGLTITAIETSLGFSRGSIYKFDNNAPSAEKLLSIANFLGVSVESLVYDVEPIYLSFETFDLLCDAKGLSPENKSFVLGRMGLSAENIILWKNHKYWPSQTELLNLANALETDLENLRHLIKNTEDEQTGKFYYSDKATAEVAERIFRNDKLRMTFDALSNVPEDELDRYCAVIEALKKAEKQDVD